MSSTRTRPRTLALVTLLYAALTGVLTYPLSTRAGDTVLADGPDMHLFIWTLAWDAHAITHDPVRIFDANIYYPRANTLAYSENLIGSGVIAAPVIWLTGNHVLALNSVLLLSCVLCALGGFVLARRLGLGVPAALLCGIIFAFAPARLTRITQAHLATIQWIPFALASFHGYLAEGRARDLRLALFWLLLQALTSGHGAAFLLLGMACLAGYRIALGEPLAALRRLRDAGAPGAIMLALTAAIAAPYRFVQSTEGLRRSLENWAPTPASFVASPTWVHQRLLGLLGWQAHVNEVASAFLFPGVMPLALAAAGLWWSLTGRFSRDAARVHPVAPYWVMGVVAVFIAMGPPLGIWPLVYWLPGLNLVRVPSRFMLLTMLCVGVAAAWGFERLSARLSPSRRGWAALGVGALLVAEFSMAPLTVEPYAVDIPAIDRWLGTQPTPFAIAEVPLPSPGNLGGWERAETTYMLHSLAHYQPTVHGYSGHRPAFHEGLYRALLTFPDRESLDILTGIGVRYVVVHTDQYEPGEWPGVEARLEAWRPRLRLAHVEGAGRAYELLAPPR